MHITHSSVSQSRKPPSLTGICSAPGELPSERSRQQGEGCDSIARLAMNVICW